MSVVRLLCSIGFLLLAACAPKEGVATDNPLRAELEMLTGSNARKCGFVALDQDPVQAWECAKDTDRYGRLACELLPESAMCSCMTRTTWEGRGCYLVSLARRA